MTRFTGRRALLGAGLMAFFGMGCNPSWLYFLNRGDGKQPPQYPLAPKDGKKEVTVAILTSASPTLAIDYAGSEREVATLVGKKMTEETKEGKNPIKAIESSKVDKAKNAPGIDWRTVNPASLGKQLGADYVLDVTINTMTMNPSEYAGEYFKGEANFTVLVYDTSKPDSVHQQYTRTASVPLKGASSVTATMYRRMLIERLASEIAWQHIPHTSDREVASVR